VGAWGAALFPDGSQGCVGQTVLNLGYNNNNNNNNPIYKTPECRKTSVALRLPWPSLPFSYWFEISYCISKRGRLKSEGVSKMEAKFRTLWPPDPVKIMEGVAEMSAWVKNGSTEPLVYMYICGREPSSSKQSSSVTLKDLSDGLMSALKRGTPLSKAIIWPILHDNRETVLSTNRKSHYAFDWYQNKWPWMTLMDVMTADARYLCGSWASCLAL